MNPYDWKRQEPKIEVLRSEVGPLLEGLRRGNSAVLLAGRGMGKTVFLDQLRRELDKFSEVRVILFPEPPAELTIRSCLEELARQLGVDVDRAVTASDVVRAYWDQDVPPNIVLLFDEFDRYAREPDRKPTDQPGRNYFNSLESMRRRFPGVGILAAGSIGVCVFRDALGSSFLARADKIRISPFRHAELEVLAQPYSVYRQECLADYDVETLPADPDSPVRAQFRVRSQTSDGMSVEVDHYLLRLPRGR